MRSFFFFLNSAEESFLAFLVETILFPMASNFSSSFSRLVRDGEKRKESLWKTYFVIITLQSWSRTLSLHPVMSTGRHFTIPKLLVSMFQIVVDIGAIGGGVREGE
jgi:hypothetical protein